MMTRWRSGPGHENQHSVSTVSEHFACAQFLGDRDYSVREQKKSGACYGLRWSERAAHADRRTSLSSPRERGPSLVRFLLHGSPPLSLSLSHSPMTHATAARSPYSARHRCCTHYQHKCKCIRNGEAREALDRCAGLL